MNVNAFVGKPYAIPCDPPNTYDCWELARCIRELGGKYTPSYVEYAKRSEAVLETSIETPPKGWYMIMEPELCCLVLIGKTHCGVYIGDGNVMHANEKTGVRVDRLDVLQRLDHIRFAEWNEYATY